MDNFTDFFQRWIQNDAVQRLLIVAVAIVIVFVLLYYVRRLISRRVSDIDHKYRVRKAASVITYLLIVMILLVVYGDKLGNIGVAVGLAGAGIAFALSEVITSIAGWFSIMLTGIVRVGQRVRIGHIAGDIIDIRVLKTTIMEIGDWVDGDLYNGRITTLSNSFVFKEPIRNYSADYPFLWDEITVPIRTSSDYHLARNVFTDVVNEVCGKYARDSAATWESMKDKYRIENARVDPMITLTFDENWITFTIRYIVDYRERRSTKDRLYSRLLEEIAKYDNVVMIAATSVEVTNVPTEGKDQT